MTSEKGASNRLIALPLKRHGFIVKKSEFRDGRCIRYNIEAKNKPMNCSCREISTLSYALHCAKGGYSQRRHNEIRVTVTKIMHEFSNDAKSEPILQLLQVDSFIHKTKSTDEHPRLETKTNRLRGSRFSRFFFDVKIFYPIATLCR